MPPTGAAFLWAGVLAVSACTTRANPTFKVANDTFQLNGAPVQLFSGSIHYHRVHPSLWRDRLARLRAMGLNAIQTYVPWNWHEHEAQGVFDFSSPARNISEFLAAAAEQDLLVLLRPGPYICGEHDFGGLPWYLLTTPGIALRTNNTAYLAAVDTWWTAVLTEVKPWLVGNGGPIAMIQMENEFGSYGNTQTTPDAAYMLHLKAAATSILGSDAQLYTTDGGDVGYLSKGALPGEIFATGDGNGPPGPMFAAADTINPPGWRASTSSEYYPGWLTHWGESMANTSALDTVAGMTQFFALGASLNLYMAHGTWTHPPCAPTSNRLSASSWLCVLARRVPVSAFVLRHCDCRCTCTPSMPTRQPTSCSILYSACVS